MKKRTIYIGLFLIFIIGVVSLIGTFATDSTITEGNSSKADYLFNITLGDRTNREIVIPSYDSKIVDIKISNPNEFNISYLLYLEGVNSNISIVNIGDTDANGVINSKCTNLIKVFIQNNSGTDTTVSIKDIVGFEREVLELPSNSTAINKGVYYKAIVKSNNKDYGKVKPNIKLSTKNGTVKYNIVPNDGYRYKSTTCEGTVIDNILTISNITSNISCEVVFEKNTVQVNLDMAGGVVETTYTKPQEYTYTIAYAGAYKIELWGAQGGGTNGGKGAYTAGNTNFDTNEVLKIYVGGSGNSSGAGGYNGGGNAGVLAVKNDGGGGSTDVRYDGTTINSRIMVAGGGGGANANGSNAKGVGKTGGAAGGLSGYAGTSVVDKMSGSGGTQISGGAKGKTARVPGTDGSFYNGGVGGTSKDTPTISGGGGGGGGYYGGGSGEACLGNCGGSGGGGSSYISGHTGCVAITSASSVTPKTGCTTGTSDNSCSIHYSGKSFTNTVMIDGSGYSWTNAKKSLQQMPSLSGSYASGTGNSGNGAARITLTGNASYTVIYKDKYGTLPTPTKNGYTFGGWYTGENGTGTKVDENTVLTNINNHTLHAYWIKSTSVLYDYIKNNADTTTTIDFSKTSEASNTNGIYTTTNTDSGNPVYYYRGNVDNHVLFANMCWRIIRTTEAGGVKLIYDGKPSNGSCNNTGENTTIGTSTFNAGSNDAKYVGYMYGSSISDTSNTTNSTIKTKIDTWYQNNMTSYTSQLEDTVFCNDRSYTAEGSTLRFGALTRLLTNKTPTLKCQNTRDKFTTKTINGNGALKYPVGLITADEAAYAGANHLTGNSSFYLYNNKNTWAISPYVFGSSSADGYSVSLGGHILSHGTDVSIYVRPVISLKSGTIFSSGSGKSTDPFVIAVPTLTLYDYIKNNADTTTTIDFSKTSAASGTNGIYTTSSTDSAKAVYYYRGNVNNHLIFANFCWKIVRTTETSGVKLIYDGVPSSGKCNNTGSATTIGNSVFNSSKDNSKYVGYKYGSSVSDTSNTTDSTIKTKIDTWYQNNMTSYTSQLEDIVFCNDRSYTASGSRLNFGAYTRLGINKNPTLKCQNTKDKFTVNTSNGNGKLTYPVGLITADEISYAGGVYSKGNSSFYLYTGSYYWSLSPHDFSGSYAGGLQLYSDGDLVGFDLSVGGGVRPVISLKSGATVTGSGTATNPFVVE